PAAATRRRAELLAAVRINLAAIILGALLGVAQQVEGGRDALEALLRDLVARILVRVQFLGQLAERLLDLVRARASGNAQFLVGIASHVRFTPTSEKDQSVS